jgi:cobalamin synthase
MLKDYPVKSFIVYAIISSIVYLIPAIIFIEKETFAAIWLLYLGNAFFLVSIFAFMLIYKAPSNKNTAKLFMLFSGHIVTVMAIILSCVLLLIIILVVKPSFFETSVQKNITRAPANTNGLTFSLYVDAIFGNMAAGSFASIITSFASRSKYKQTPEP